MRIFFVFLLLLNVLYAAWNFLYPVKIATQVKPLPEDLKTLQLLSEIDKPAPDEFPVSEPESVKIDSEPESKPVLPPSCYTLGPFKDENIMQQVKGALAETTLELSMRKREESERHRYWVHIPSLGSRADARAMSKRLGKEKIKDFYIVRSGDNKNSISLGHFREKKHAERRLSNLKKRGFEANLEVIYRQYNLYWLDYSIGPEQAENDDFIEKFLIDGVSRLDRDCQ